MTEGPILGCVSSQEVGDQDRKAARSSGTEPMPPMSVLDELVSLGTQERRGLATTLRQVSETFAEVSDGKATSHVLGVLAHLLEPG